MDPSAAQVLLDKISNKHMQKKGGGTDKIDEELKTIISSIY